MKCEKCPQGNLRVIVTLLTDIDYPNLICDNCFQGFTLATESVIEFNDPHNAYNTLQKLTGDTRSYEEHIREEMNTSPTDFPLLETWQQNQRTS